MLNQFRYILLFGIVLFSGFSAAAQLAMPDSVYIGAIKHYYVDPNPDPGSIYTWKIDGVTQVSSATNEIDITWNTAGTYLLVVQELSINGCIGQLRSGQVFVSPSHAHLPPVAVNDYDSTRMNIPININILKNDYDPDGKIASVSICGGPYNGLALLNSDNTIAYTPGAGFTGIDSLCYFICDNNVPVLCDTASVYIFVIGRSPASRLTIYNVISPNGDGDNDLWIIDGIEEFPVNSVVIFNRWGDKINNYERYDNKTVVWNGTNQKGYLVPDGTYYYILSIKDIDTMTGWIFVRNGRQ